MQAEMTSAGPIDLRDVPARPRRVVRRAELGWYFGPVRFGVVLFSLVTLSLLAVAAVYAGVATWGNEARATFMERRHVGYGRHAYTEVRYAYVIDGEVVEGSDKVSPRQFRDTPQGALIEVRWMRVGGVTLDVLPKGLADALLADGNLLLVTLVGNCVALGLVWRYFVRPSVYRRLLREGEPAVGIITDREAKEIKDNDRWGSEEEREPFDRRMVYHIAYEFDAGGQRRDGRMRVAVEDFERARMGDEAVVFYDVKHPGINVIYPFGDDVIVE